MSTKPHKLRRYVTISLIAVALLLVTLMSQLHPRFPKPEDYSTETMEDRIYLPFIRPLAGRSLRAGIDRLAWHVTEPGQVKLVEVAALPGVVDLTDAFKKLGYDFPEGTSLESGCMVPEWRIRHYPSVLNHMEHYLHLERKR